MNISCDGTVLVQKRVHCRSALFSFAKVDEAFDDQIPAFLSARLPRIPENDGILQQ